jgi:hypothetical protein
VSRQRQVEECLPHLRESVLRNLVPASRYAQCATVRHGRAASSATGQRLGERSNPELPTTTAADRAAARCGRAVIELSWSAIGDARSPRSSRDFDDRSQVEIRPLVVCCMFTHEYRDARSPGVQLPQRRGQPSGPTHVALHSQVQGRRCALDQRYAGPTRRETVSSSSPVGQRWPNVSRPFPCWDGTRETTQTAEQL